MTTTTVTITDRNESKFLKSRGLTGTPTPRDNNTLDFKFDATEELFLARRDYSLNASIPVLTFIEASRFIDKCIHDYRAKGASL